MNMKHRIAAGVIAGLFTTSLLASPGAHGPNGEHLDGQANATAGGLARLPDGSVNVPKLAQRRMGVRTLMAKEGEFARTVQLNGRATIDPNAGGRVQAPFAGQIAPGPNGLPVAGQRVVKGQVLARLRPTGAAIERGNQAAQLAELRANRALLEKRVARLHSLEGVVPAKDVEAAQAELIATIGQERAVAKSIGGVEAIVAPANGVVASASVLNGQIVESRDVLFEIVDPQRMLVEALSTEHDGEGHRAAGGGAGAQPGQRNGGVDQVRRPALHRAAGRGDPAGRGHGDRDPGPEPRQQGSGRRDLPDQPDQVSGPCSILSFVSACATACSSWRRHCC